MLLLDSIMTNKIDNCREWTVSDSFVLERLKLHYVANHLNEGIWFTLHLVIWKETAA